MLNLIACKRFSLGHSSQIGRANVFRGSFEFTAGPRLFIGDFNVFSCPKHLDHPKLADRRYAARVEFGEDCLVNDGHYLDAHGRVTIGDRPGSPAAPAQFFTHGVGVRDRDIAIGKGCFIGTAARFAPGSGVGDRNLVGIASVVVGRIAANESLISGFPAQAIRSISDDLACGKYQFSKGDWVE